MKIDAYSHFVPLRFLDFLERSENTGAHVFRQLFGSVRTLHDVGARIDFMERLNIDTHILVPLPWIEGSHKVYSDPKLSAEAARIANDEMAAVVARHPDRFLGVAILPTGNREQMLEEALRAVDVLGMVGVVLFVGPTVKRIDHPDYEELYALAHHRKFPLWLHPCRPMTYADYIDENASKFLIWQTLGWVGDTSTAMVRMVFGGMFERYPGLKVIIHHHGALIPMFAKRMETSYEFFEQSGGMKFETPIRQPYIDQFRKFYCDTATFGFEPPLVQMALNFFGIGHVLFGTDTPMDAKAGEIMTEGAEQSIDALMLSPQDKAKIYGTNILMLLERVGEAGRLEYEKSRIGLES